MAYRTLILLDIAVSIVALLLVLSGCGPEKTSDEPRPANAPCERCGPRPTLTQKAAP